MKFYILTAMLAAYASIGCGRDCEGVWTYVPDEWSPTELQDLRMAERDWNEFAGHHVVTLVERTSENVDACTIDPGESVSQDEKKAGVYRFWTGSIEINTTKIRQIMYQDNGFHQPYTYAVILHEIGHGLGMDHVEGNDNIMYPETGPTHWGPEDWEQCVDKSICEE